MRTDRSTPDSNNEYIRTYNHAIDLVGEALGWAKKYSSRVVSAIVLKPTKYLLFVEGLKTILASKGIEWNNAAPITWEGVEVLQGSRGMIDSIRIEYVENMIKFPKQHN